MQAMWHESVLCTSNLKKNGRTHWYYLGWMALQGMVVCDDSPFAYIMLVRLLFTFSSLPWRVMGLSSLQGWISGQSILSFG